MSDLHKKLVEMQSELKAPKNNRNSFGNYNYRSAEDILEAAKPLLKAKGLTLILTDAMQNLGDRYYLCAKAKLSDGSETVEVVGIAREAEIRKGMDDSQLTGATSSYARKYALGGLFALDDTKDADATNTGDSAASEPTKPKASSNKGMSAKQRQLINDKLKEYYVESANRAGFIEFLAGSEPSELTSADASDLIDMLINEEQSVKDSLADYRKTL